MKDRVIEADSRMHRSKILGDQPGGHLRNLRDLPALCIYVVGSIARLSSPLLVKVFICRGNFHDRQSHARLKESLPIVD
jgi:hypothetical protein